MATASAVLGRPDVELARKKLIVALDFWTIDEARKLVKELGDEVTLYKVGIGLQLIGGDVFAKELNAQEKSVFLDYKLFDTKRLLKMLLHKQQRFGLAF